jgi:hypothetical protein
MPLLGFQPIRERRDLGAKMPQSHHYFYRLGGLHRGSFRHLIIFLPLQEVEKMIFEAALYLPFAAALVGIMKAYKRRRDVLYGPYVRQNDWNARGQGPHRR